MTTEDDKEREILFRRMVLEGDIKSTIGYIGALEERISKLKKELSKAKKELSNIKDFPTLEDLNFNN